MIDKKTLQKLYQKDKKSTYEIASILGCSSSKVLRWMKKYDIKPRDISKDIIGNRYGKLIVIEELGDRRTKSGKRYVKFLCRCECGRFKTCLKHRLMDGRNTSCGCSSGKPSEENGNWNGYQKITGTYWGSLKRGAKNRGFPFDISIEEAWDIYIKQNKTCALTGEYITMPAFTKNERKITKDRKKNFASLDRIDNSLGYSAQNCQWVTRELNMLKGAMDNEHFIKICRSVCNYAA